jgi:hypothetical protein
MPSGVWCGVALSVACALVSTSAAAGPDLTACVAAFEDAQALNKKARYLDAIERSRACTDPSCGDIVAAECTKLSEAILQATPIIVPAAHDTDQNDLVDVRFYVDGKLVRDKLDGRPLPLDPGTHVFRFEAPGLPPVEKSQMVRAGEKMRIVSATLTDPRKPPSSVLDAKQALSPRSPVAAPPKPPSVFVSRSAAAATLSLAGIGALALAGFGVLRWSGINDYNSLYATCRPNCNPSSVDSAREKLIFSDVALGVGVASVGTALALLGARFAAGSSTEVRVVPQSAGGAAQFVLRF